MTEQKPSAFRKGAVFSLALIALAFTGVSCCSLCMGRSEEVRYDSGKREPTTRVEIFRDGQKPTRACKEVATFTFNGPEVDEPKAERDFMRRAQRLGADAIIFEPKTRTGTGLAGLSVVNTFLYKATAVVYE